MKTIRTIICCVVLFATVCLFAGCHTMHGAGEDIEKGGEHIQKAAE